MDESTESPTLQRISFSFEHHKSSLKQSSAELYRALKLMTWRSKSTVLSSDQGLIELTSHFSSGRTSIKQSLLMSFLLACLVFSSVTALLFLIEVREARIKWPIAAAAFVLGFIVGMVMGGIQSLSRSTYSKLLPETTDHASYFSFFDVTEKIAIVIGMFSFGFINEITGSQRNSVLALCIFFIIGLVLMYRTSKLKGHAGI